MKGWILQSVALLALAFVAVVAQRHLDAYRTPEQVLEEQVHLPSGKALQVLSLGFQSVLADYLWIKTVIYFGKRTLDEDNPYLEIVRRKKQLAAGRAGDTNPGEWPHGVSQSGSGTFAGNGLPASTAGARATWNYDPKLFRILHAFPSAGLAPFLYPLLWRVVELDPHFLYPYEFGGVVALMNTGETREALRLLVRGWQQNPEHWEFPFYLAFVELFYLGNRDQALRFLAHALALPGRPASVERLYVSLAREAGDRSVVADMLRSLAASSQNPQFRQQVLDIVQKLTGP